MNVGFVLNQQPRHKKNLPTTRDGCVIVKKNLETPYPDEGHFIEL